MTHYRIVLGYDGTDFRGWQRQAADRTVQGVVESALARFTGKRTVIHGAGRTDAGVHALGQVASFRGDFRLDDREFLRALNALLPGDIRVFSLERTGPEFHARKSARSKIYEYRIVLAPQINPLVRRYALHWPYPFDLPAVRRAARMFLRKADFTAFSSNRDRRPMRTILRSEIRKRGDEVVYTVEADGFLRYMVRTMVGTLIEIGRGKYPPERIEELFARRDRKLAGPTAPARGLCLVRVLY